MQRSLRSGWGWAGITALSTGAAVFLAQHLWQSGPVEQMQALADGRYMLLEAAAPTPPVPIPTLPESHTPETNAAPDAPQEGVRAPSKALLEQSPDGALPMVSKDGMKPLEYYARASAAQTGPAVAVLITGLGLRKADTEAALRLPPEISLSLSPYGPDANMWAMTTRAKGHEAFIDLPVEPIGFPATDPGSHALLSGNTPAENQTRLRWILSRTQGYAGVVLPPNEAVSTQKDVSEPLWTQLGQRGLLAVQSAPLARHTAAPALPANLSALQADGVLLADAPTDTLRTQLATIEAIAQQRGQALLVAPANPYILNELTTWITNLPQRGFHLTPATSITKQSTP